jgi:hypothetical protein
MFALNTCQHCKDGTKILQISPMGHKFENHEIKPQASLRALAPCAKLLCNNFVDVIVIEQFLPHLHVNLSMLWHLCQVNKTWYKIVGRSKAWNAFEIMKYDNHVNCQAISLQGF